MKKKIVLGLILMVMIFVLCGCSSEIDTHKRTVIEAYIKLDGLEEPIHVIADRYSTSTTGNIWVHVGDLTYITGNENVLIVKYDISELPEEPELLQDGDAVEQELREIEEQMNRQNMVKEDQMG